MSYSVLLSWWCISKLKNMSFTLAWNKWELSLSLNQFEITSLKPHWVINKNGQLTKKFPNIWWIYQLVFCTYSQGSNIQKEVRLWWQGGVGLNPRPTIYCPCEHPGTHYLLPFSKFLVFSYVSGNNNAYPHRVVVCIHLKIKQNGTKTPGVNGIIQITYFVPLPSF